MMANEFDVLERQALRTSEIGTSTNLRKLRNNRNSTPADPRVDSRPDDQKLRKYEDIMRRGITAHPSRYQDDPRAKRYLGSQNSQKVAAQEDKEKMGRINFWDGAKPEGWGAGTDRNMWSDFGTGGQEEDDGSNQEEQGEDQNQQVNRRQRPEEDTEDTSDGIDETSGQSGDDNTSTEDNVGQKPDSTESEVLNETGDSTTSSAGLSGSKTGKTTANAAGEAANAVGGAGETVGLAGEAATAAGSAAPAVAGLAAAAPVAEGAVVVGAAATVSPLGILLIIGAIFIFLVALTLFFFWNPEDAKGGETTGASKTVICVDPGHPSELASSTSASDYAKDKASWESNKTGANGGTSGGGVTERKINQQVADLLVQELRDRGYSVVETKSDSETFMSNLDRGKTCSNAKAAVMVKVHNDGGSGAYNGMNFYYPNKSIADSKAKDNSVAYEMSDSTFSSAIDLKEALKKAFSDGQTKYSYAYNSTSTDGQKNNNNGFGYTYNIPTTLLEMSDMGGSSVNFIKNTDNQKKIVKALADGIEGFVPATSGVSGSCQALLPGTSSIGFLHLPKKDTFNVNGGSPASQQWGSPELVSFLTSAADTWAAKHPTSKITIGDLSLENGGKIGGHASHQAGNDVDITSHGNPSFISTVSNYEKSLAIEFAKQLFDTKAITFIFYNDKEVQAAVNAYATEKKLPGVMKSWPGHENHFHVRMDPSLYAAGCGFTESAGGKKGDAYLKSVGQDGG